MIPFNQLISNTANIQIWNVLKILNKDRGLSKPITLLRDLISFTLENADNMNDYIGKFESTANKLAGIGFVISSEWLGAMAGLTENYNPLIMGIETNMITADLSTSKLFDMPSSSETSAFLNKNKEKP